MPPSLARFVIPLALALMFAGNAIADEMDDRYLRILSTIDQAEEQQLRGNLQQSRARYQTAQKELLELKAADPTWKPAMVAHRLTTIAEKLRAPSPKPATDAPAPANPAAVKLIGAGVKPGGHFASDQRPAQNHRAW